MCQSRLFEGLCKLKNAAEIIGDEITGLASKTPTYIGHRPQDVCGRGTTIHSQYRMGYDGQNKVFPTEHAVVILHTLLPVSTYRYKNEIADTKTKSYVHR